MKLKISPSLLKFISSEWNILLVISVLTFAVIVVRTAWVSDDSYITFRTVDNIVNGYGPTWNTTERVQAYTHPLWMLLMTAFYFVTREMFFTSISVSIVISLLAVSLFAFGIARSQVLAILGIIILGFRGLLDIGPGESANTFDFGGIPICLFQV